MKIEISYNSNEQLWSMESIAAAHGYTKTDECYWVQIFTNENGDSIVTTRDDAESAIDPVERLAAILDPQPAEITVDDLREGLDLGDYGEYLNDYRDSSAYIYDAIHEIADNCTSIYYSDIMKYISENPESLADVIAEGLYDPTRGYDLYQHGQAAEYMTIQNDLYTHQADALFMAALDFLKYDMKRETIPAELADELRGWCDDDPGDRMDEIPDRIREYFAEQEEENA